MALEEVFSSRPPVTRAAVCALMTRPIPCLQRPHTARLSVSHVILGGPDKPSSPGAPCRNVSSTPLMITARVLCVPMSVYSLLSVIIGAPDVFLQTHPMTWGSRATQCAAPAPRCLVYNSPHGDKKCEYTLHHESVFRMTFLPRDS